MAPSSASEAAAFFSASAATASASSRARLGVAPRLARPAPLLRRRARSAVDRRERRFDGGGGGMALCLRARHLLQQRLAALGGGRHAQAVVVQDLHGAALAGIEIADQPAGRHLVELDARQLAQRLAALLAQPLGLADGRAERAVELALPPRAAWRWQLSIDDSVCRPVHIGGPTTS